MFLRDFRDSVQVFYYLELDICCLEVSLVNNFFVNYSKLCFRRKVKGVRESNCYSFRN